MRKYIIFSVTFILLIIITTFSCFGASYSSYDGNGNNLSSTYIDYLKSALSDISPDEDYILFRDGQYSYTLAVSKNFTFSNNVLSGKAEILRLYVTEGSSSYNSRYRVQISEDDNFKYYYEGYMIYSNCIENVPDIMTSASSNSKLPYILIGVGVLTMFFIGFLALNRSKGGVRA